MRLLRLTPILASMLMLATASEAQSPITLKQVITVSGTSQPFPNKNGSMHVSFEELIAGSPGTVSIVIPGCKLGNTCDTLDTNTTVANAIRSPSINKPYDSFVITASWTGGTNVAVTLNATLTTANGGGGGGVGAYAVASLPSGQSVGTLAVAVDGSSSTDCVTGGGTTLVLCRYDGTAWGTFPAGSASAGGSPGNLQYNNAGALAGFADGTTHQVLHGGKTFGAVTSADVDTSVAQTGVDISTSFQVTALHLPTPAQCPTNNFSTGNTGAGGSNCAQPSFSNLSGSLNHSQLPILLSADIPNNAANTSGNASTATSAAALSVSGQSGLLSITGLLSTNRTKTVRDAADTFLELGGSYTPSGTWNWTSASVTWPTFNQSTTGSAAALSISGQSGLLSFTGLASTNRVKTVRDAADTLLELGGSYTPSGTWNWNSASVTWPTFNQNTTGLAAGLSSANSPSTNGDCILRYHVTASAQVPQDCALSGLLVTTPSSPYTGVYSDRGTLQRLVSGSTFTWNLPQVTGTTASNFFFAVSNKNSGNLTLTANAADKIDGSATGGSQTVLPEWLVQVFQDSSSSPGNWWTNRIPLFEAFPSCADSGGNHLNFTTSGGFSCGNSGSGGGSTTLQTNGTNNTSQTALNFVTSTANTAGLTVTPSNPSTSSEVMEVSGTLAHASLPTLLSGDIPSNAANTSGNAATATKATNVAGGSTGSIHYQSATDTTAMLAGNTAATDQVLVSHGTGSAAQAPTLSGAPAISGANLTAFPTTITTQHIGSAGTCYGQNYTASGSITAFTLVSLTSSGAVSTAGTGGGPVRGVAQATVTNGQTVNVCFIGPSSLVMDGTATAGDVGIPSTSTGGDGHDSAQTSSNNIGMQVGDLGAVITGCSGSGCTATVALKGADAAGRQILSAYVPTLNQNTTGTAANLSGTPALPNGTTATTQSACDNSTKLSTTAYAGAVCNLVETSGSPLSAAAQSQTIWNNTASAYVVNLPTPTSSGPQICLGNYKTQASAISLVPGTGVTIYYKGVAGTSGSATGLKSAGAAGDFVCLEGTDSTTYEAIGAGQGTWTNN